MDDPPEAWEAGCAVGVVVGVAAAEDGFAPNPNPEFPNEPPNPPKAPPALGAVPKGEGEGEDAGVAED